MNNSAPTSGKQSSEPTPVEPTYPTRVLIRLVGAYQRLRAGRISPCRFYPSCSEYAAEALAEHGAARGSWLALRRVLRCRPFGPHGIDLVPEPRKARNL